MKIEIKDKLNIKNEEMHVKPTRVKVFILNKNKFVLISAFDGYQLPGGHVEENENLLTAILREVKEETGIELNNNEIPTPFFRIERYSKTEGNLNKCSIIIYYYIQTNKNVDLNNRNLTDHEKENNYSLELVEKEEIENVLKTVMQSSSNAGSKIVAEETLYAYNILKETL